MKIYPSTNFADPITTPTTISVNSSSTALRITQTGAGNALVVEDSVNPDSNPFIIANDGTVIIGALFPIGAEKLYVASDSSLGYLGASAGAAGSPLRFRRSKGTVATPLIVAAEDVVSNIQFYGYDGVNFIESARITASVDGTPSTNDMPGRLTFFTTADGASTPTERMRIDNTGNVGIGATANVSALLDVQSTTKGVRMPNMTTTQKNAISSPAAGLMVFDTTLSKLCVYTGAVWQTITSV